MFSIFELSSLETAVESNQAVAALRAPLPQFLHKWTKARRSYERGELILPERVRIHGRAPINTMPLFAVGGTRSPSVESFCLASQVVRILAGKGAAIVSGGVPGIDLAAHLAAIDSGAGETFAVLANPVEEGLEGHEWSSPLLESGILANGGLISEYTRKVEISTGDYRERLLQRDRIISGVCDVFIAFECSEQSATLDTAFRALAQGKTVFAVHSAHQNLRQGLAVLSADPRVLVLRETEQAVQTIASSIFSAALARERFSRTFS